jgi:hypothetical protein
MPINISVYSANGIASIPVYKMNGKPKFHAHRSGDITSGVKSWLTYQFDPILHWGVMFFLPRAEKTIDSSNDVGPQAGFYIELYFDNLFGFSHAMGNLTNCRAEKMIIEMFHDSAVKLKVITPYIGKRWFLWRIKNILHCWFCDACGAPLPLSVALSDNTSTLLALPVASSAQGASLLPSFIVNNGSLPASHIAMKASNGKSVNVSHVASQNITTKSLNSGFILPEDNAAPSMVAKDASARNITASIFVLKNNTAINKKPSTDPSMDPGTLQNTKLRAAAINAGNVLRPMRSTDMLPLVSPTNSSESLLPSLGQNVTTTSPIP